VGKINGIKAGKEFKTKEFTIRKTSVPGKTGKTKLNLNISRKSHERVALI
jgi:hypothetical protein